jgi:hypothetical protein
VNLGVAVDGPEEVGVDLVVGNERTEVPGIDEDLAVTASPLVNVQPALTLMVKVWESVVVIEAATWLIDLPWASWLIRPWNSRFMMRPPPTSLVLVGKSGFCGSVPAATMMPRLWSGRRNRRRRHHHMQTGPWPGTLR